MAETRRQLTSGRIANPLEDSDGHPFGLPLIVDMSSQKEAYRTPTTKERRRSRSNDSRYFEPRKIDSANFSSQNASLASSWSSQHFVTSSSASSIKFPSIFSTPPSPSPAPSLSESTSRRLPSMVSAYDVIVKSCVASFVELSFSIDTEVFKQANQVLEAFRVQRNFLLSSTGFTDPEMPLTGTGPEQARKIREIKEMCHKCRDGRSLAYLSYISSTVGILGWVVSGNNPNQFIRDVYNNGKHHADQIRKSESESRRRINEKWIAAWKWIVSELDSYVGKFHPEGLKWHKS